MSFILCDSVGSFWVKKNLRRFFLNCLFICVLSLEIQLSRCGWHPIDQFNHGFFCIQWFEVRGDCFVDIGGIVMHNCLNFLFIILLNAPLHVIDTDCIARYNSNFHTYTTTKIPIIPVVSSLDNGKPIICGILYIAIADLNQLCFLLCSIYLISDCVRRYHFSFSYHIRIMLEITWQFKGN